MLIVSQPASWNHLDSARVEKRGPWMTTTVPPSRALMPSSPAVSTRRAPAGRGSTGRRRRRGSSRGRRRTCRAAARPVDELVADDELTQLELGLERAGGVRADDPPHAQLAHRPDVRPVRDRVRRQLVLQAVPRQERDSAARDLADGEGRGRLPKGCRSRPPRRPPGTSRTRSRRTRRPRYAVSFAALV